MQNKDTAGMTGPENISGRPVPDKTYTDPMAGNIRAGMILADLKTSITDPPRYRVLHIKHPFAVLCKMDTSKIDIFLKPLDMIMDDLETGDLTVVKEETPVFDPGSLPPNIKAVYERNREIVNAVSEVFGPYYIDISSRKSKPLYDELAEKCGPFKTVTELKADIKKNLKAQNEHKLNEKYKDDLVNALVKKSKIPAPEILIDDQMRMIRDDMTRNAAAQGLSFEDFLDANGETLENWEKEARKIAEQRVKASLALQNVALAEKITVSDDEVGAKIAELKDVYKKSPDALKQLKDPNVKMDIKNRMTIEKTLDYLVKANS